MGKSGRFGSEAIPLSLRAKKLVTWWKQLRYSYATPDSYIGTKVALS